MISQPPSTRSAFEDDRKHRDVVAGLAVTGREDVAVGGLLEHPVAGRVAGAMQVGAQPDEVVVHVDRDRRRRGDVGDAALDVG